MMATPDLPRPADLTASPHSVGVGEFFPCTSMAFGSLMGAGLVFCAPVVAALLVCGAAAAGIAVWRRIDTMDSNSLIPTAFWLALLLAMMLPADLNAG